MTSIDDVKRDFVDATRGRTGNRSASKSGSTEISAIQDGRYLNIYPGADVLAVVKVWKRGANLRWERHDGIPAVIRLRSATDGRGFTLRNREHQRMHLCVPTSHVGGLRNAEMGMKAAEAWVEGDEVGVRVPAEYFTPTE